MIERIQVPGFGEYIAPRGIFKVSRTASWSFEGPVVEGAFRGLILHKDQRTVKTIEENPYIKKEWKSPPFFGYGVNETGIFRHRIVECDDWLVEMEWSDVEKFVEKHGQCVVGIDGAGYNWIEIYDDYRE